MTPQIYLSSTYIDLKKHRKVVHETLKSKGLHCLGMEYYQLSDDRPLERCLKDVRESDAYIILWARRRGSFLEGKPESITMLEYREAVKTKKPIFVLLLAENYGNWPPEYEEQDEGADHVREFRNELKQWSAAEFTTPSSLKTLLLRCEKLSDFKRRFSNNSRANSLLNQALQEFRFKDTDYSNKRVETFIGRRRLLEDVEKWIKMPNSYSVFWLEAEVGFGKSTFAAQVAKQNQAKLIAFKHLTRPLITGNERIEFALSIIRQVMTYVDPFQDWLTNVKRTDRQLGTLLTRLEEEDDHDRIVEALLNGILVNGLIKCQEKMHGERRLIILDGLDEAAYVNHDGCFINTMAQFLEDVVWSQRLRDEANWVRFLLTSRRDRSSQAKDSLAEFRESYSGCFRVPRISRRNLTKSDKAELFADAETYIQTNISGDLEHLNIDVRKLIRKSRRSFLYLHFFCEHVRQNGAPPSKFPDDLAGWYQRQIKKLFSNGIPPRYVDAISIVAAGRNYKIAAADVESCLNDGERSVSKHVSLESVSAEFNSLFSVIDGKVEFFHSSFLNWLLKVRPSTRSSCVSVLTGHELLGNWAVEQLSGNCIKSIQETAIMIMKTSPYWFRMGARHLMDSFLLAYHEAVNGNRITSACAKLVKIVQYALSLKKVCLECDVWAENMGPLYSELQNTLSGLSRILKLCLDDRKSPRSLLKSELLQEINSAELFALYSGSYATDNLKTVACWCACTQEDSDWNLLVDTMLHQGDYVVRSAAADAIAVRISNSVLYNCSQNDRSQRAIRYLEGLLFSESPSEDAFANRLEMACYVLIWLMVEYCEYHLKWFYVQMKCLLVRLVKPNYGKYYFVRTAIADLLLSLNMKGETGIDLIRDISKMVNLDALWRCPWQHTQLDVRFLAVSGTFDKSYWPASLDFPTSAELAYFKTSVRRRRSILKKLDVEVRLLFSSVLKNERAH